MYTAFIKKYLVISTLERYSGFIAMLTGTVFIFSGCVATPSPKSSAPESTEVTSPNPGEPEADSTTEEERTPEPSYRFTDVPIPSKFKLDRDKSFTYEAGPFKAGLMTYTGRAKLDELIDFYKKEMPNYEWEMVSIFEHKDVTLVFSKQGWNCAIGISTSTLGGSKIKIQIGPINTQ